MSCDEMTMLMPSSLRLFRMSNTLSTPSGSRPAVGSSSIIMSGLMATIPAMATLFCCPPLKWWGVLSSKPLMPTISRASDILLSTSSYSRPKFIGPKATSSLTVGANSWSFGSWNTIPTFCLTLSSSSLSKMIFSPSTSTCPDVGSVKPLK